MCARLPLNATFEDTSDKKPEFDPEASTSKFVEKIPKYAMQGVNAITLCLQGGMPGYEGAVKAFDFLPWAQPLSDP